MRGICGDASGRIGPAAAAAALLLACAAVTLGGATSTEASIPTAVVVGTGFVDASSRAVVRTSGDRVYLFAADDTAQRTGAGPGVIHAYRAGQAGIPTSFGEADASHRPTATGSTHVLGAPDVRLDRSGISDLVYVNETNRNVVFRTFSTLTDTWGPTEVIGTNGAPIASSIKREGNATLVLDQNDASRVVYSTGAALVYRSRAGGSWSAPVTVASGGAPIHPQLAFDSAGTLHLAWLQDGASPSIHYRSLLAAAGAWGPDETVAGTDVLGNSNSDQGPSIVVTSAGVPHVLYVSAARRNTNGADYGAVQIRFRSSSGWTTDTIPTDLLVHTPQIYAQNNDVYAFLGHDTSIHFGYAWQDGGGSWSPYTVLYPGSTVDGSASIRWDPQRETNPNVIDAGFFDEDISDNKTYLPRLYYIAVLPRGGQLPAPDTTPPTVSLTAPSAGATVSGTITVAASAADNVGVAGVQFTLDGNPLGAEDLAFPYSVGWDTTGAGDGTHLLAAVARDAAGNKTTAATVMVTVSNAPPPPPPDTTVPTVSLTAPAANATVSGTINVTANAADNVGVAGVQFTLDGNPLDTEDSASPYGVSWNTTTGTDGPHLLVAIARDAAGNAAVATVTVTVRNAPPPPLPDTTLPTVSLTSPAANATVSGTISVTANAADNVGVAGVQFTLDGNPLAGEDTASPYAVSWNTATSGNGTHMLAATARDAAGNKKTSAIGTVTVANAPPPDTTRPTVSLTAPAANATISETINVSANAADNVGVAGVQFTLDGKPLGAEDSTSPYGVSWNTATAADGPHQLAATARDAAGNRANAATIGVTVGNSQPGGSGGGGGGGGIPPDLHVDLSSNATNAPPVGTGVIYFVKVSTRNLGNASGVRLDLTLPADYTVTMMYSGRGPGCLGSTAPNLICDVAWIAPGVDSNVTIWGTVGRAGEQDATATVTSLVEGEPAATMADNTATLKLLPAAVLVPPHAGVPEAAPLAALRPPTLSGKPRVGATLHGTAGGWSTTPRRLAYQWQLCIARGCTPIKVATRPTLRLMRFEVGKAVRLIVTASIGDTAVKNASKKITVHKAPKS